MANWKKVIVSGSQAELNSLSLDTALTVANGGTGASSLTDGGVLVGSGTGAITALGQATNGQLIIGSTGADPVVASLSKTNAITVTSGAGTLSIGIETSGASSLVNAQTSGTGITVADDDRLIISDTSDGSGTVKYIEVSQLQTAIGGGTVTSIDVSGGTTGLTTSGGPVTTNGTITIGGTLQADNGGTGQSSYTQGDILYYDATATQLEKLAIGTSGQILAVSSGGIIEWIDNDEGDITSVANATNGGLDVTNGTGPDVTLAMDINNLSTATIDVAADFIAFSDESAAGDPTKKESVADLVDAIAGTGLSATSGVLSTTLNPTISASIYTGITGDVSITAGGVSSVNSVQANSVALGTDTTGDYVQNLTAGSLIDLQNNSGEGATPTIDVDLTEAAAATIVAGDNIIFLDGGATGTESKGSINDVANLFAGNGLTATGAVIAVDYGTSANTAAQGNTSVTFNGTANEIELSTNTFTTVGGGGTVTIGLPNDVTIANDLTVLGDLEVSGTASFKHSENLDIADKFITLSSGSTSATDGGIIVAQDASGTTQVGEGYGFDASAKRWGVTSSLDNDSGAIVPLDYMVTARKSNTGGSAPSAAPIFGSSAAGYGNIHVDSSTEDIYIYA